ncbi:MAG: hypothetical protein ACI9JN_000039 [Bacteroidia bacterium]|jgi:hypothetical protein
MHSKLIKFLRLSDNVTSQLFHFTVCLLMLCFFTGTNAQVSVNYVRVQLHSGTNIEGEMVKIEYQKYVDILMPNSDTMHIPWVDIASLDFITKEVHQRAKQLVKPKKKNVPFNNTGYYTFFDFGIPLGLDYWNYPVAGGSGTYGFGRSFSHNHHVAATIGYEGYLWPNVTVVPLGLEYYNRFKEQGRSWFYYAGTGFAFPHLSEYTWLDNSKVKGGGYFTSGFGITNKRHLKRSWYLKFGYKYQTISATYQATIWEFGSNRAAEVSEQVNFHRVDIRLGFRFD